MPFYDLYISFLLLSSVQFSCSVVSNSLRPCESQQARISQGIWRLICLYMITVCISTLILHGFVGLKVFTRSRKWKPTPITCLDIPWTEETGGLESMGSQRVRHD